MTERRKSDQLAASLKPVFVTLLTACDYAADSDSDPWDFAVPIRQLTDLGFNETDLRWLVRKDFVEHAHEITSPSEDGRNFRPIGKLTFSDKSCFILTDNGISQAHSLYDHGPAVTDNGKLAKHDSARVSTQPEQSQLAASLPHWDGQTRELSLEGAIVKRFKWQAVNQEIILSAFEEDGWPVVIDDPLPQAPDQDPKRRLQNTIKALNRHQEHSLIRFCGNGTGAGVRWRFAALRQMNGATRAGL